MLIVFYFLICIYVRWSPLSTLGTSLLKILFQAMVEKRKVIEMKNPQVWIVCFRKKVWIMNGMNTKVVTLHKGGFLIEKNFK